MNGKPVRANVKFKFVDRDGNNIDKDKFMLDEYSDLVMPKDAVNSAGIGGASGELSSTDTGHPFNVPYVISQGLHNFAALDLAVPEGTPIYAVSDGTVVESNTQTAYMHINGNYLRHTLPNGETIYYGHMQQEPLLKVGDTVKKDSKLGSLVIQGWQLGHTSTLISVILMLVCQGESMEAITRSSIRCSRYYCRPCNFKRPNA